MDSGLYLSIFSSWEVIASCLFLMFLLPLVFFIASTRSHGRVTQRVLKPRAPVKKAAPAPKPAEDENEDERDERPAARRPERNEAAEEDK